MNDFTHPWRHIRTWDIHEWATVVGISIVWFVAVFIATTEVIT